MNEHSIERDYELESYDQNHQGRKWRVLYFSEAEGRQVCVGHLWEHVSRFEKPVHGLYASRDGIHWTKRKHYSLELVHSIAQDFVSRHREVAAPEGV